MYVLRPPLLETGALHIGGVRTALFNYLFAKKFGGDFILRIEDTDSKREVAGAVDYITDSFRWLGIMPDEGYGIGGDHGPYIQSERKDIYKKHIDMLIDSGDAYYAFDTPEELETMREFLKASGVDNTGYVGDVRSSMNNSITLSSEEVKSRIDSGDNYVVRFKIPDSGDVSFNDEIRGLVTFDMKDLDDKIIWKSSDNLPTYHMANVVDDHLMEISHVIRGDEWIPSTPTHVLLYQAFGWDLPIFAHLPSILGPDGKKLSKRHAEKYGFPIFPLDWDYKNEEGNDVHIFGFREAGYEVDALLNFIALLGWNPGNDVEHMTVEEMGNLFGLDRVNKAGAMFDFDKLKSFNAHYVRSRDTDWVMEKMGITIYIGLSNIQLDMFAKMATDRVIFAKDLRGIMDYIFVRPSLEDFKIKNLNEFENVMNQFINIPFPDDEWLPNNIKFELDSISSNMGTSTGKIMPLLRVALVDGKSGPQLQDVMYILGSKETNIRVRELLSKLRQIA